MKSWQVLKEIISGHESQKGLFLSLIDSGGDIVCTNATMQKALHLANPRQVRINFFNLLHPDHIGNFREAIDQSRLQSIPCNAELYLKNGSYHPMKWQINFIDQPDGENQHYLCVGYNLVDEERLREFNRLGEKNYQLIVEGVNAGILFQDNKGELISANKKAADIFGTTLERLYQLKDIRKLWSAWEINTAEGKPVSFDETTFQRALATGETFSEDLCVTLRSGEIRWIRFNSQPLVNEDEAHPYAVITNINDITTEKQLHDEIRESDKMFRAFLGKTPNLAWVIDEDACLQFASISFYQYFGLREEQVLNKNVFDILPSVVAETLYTKHSQVLETGKSIETVEKVKWSDGTSFNFHINIFPIDNARGKRMVGGHAVNMADKFAVEKQLREANERLLLLSKATSDAIWEWDMQTGNIFRNDALMKMIGYLHEDAKGLSWWLRRIHPEDRNRVTDRIKEATDKGHHSWEDEYRFKCSDGSYKHVNDRGYVVYENGLPVKMIGSLQDISDIKQMEDLLTAEKLRRQKEISETVYRVQEKERTRIGHELHDNVNQILSTARMFVEMLEASGDEQKKLKDKSIDYLVTAIEEIRKLSKELVIPKLKGKGLVDSISALVEDIQMTSKLKIRFKHDGESDLISHGKKVTIFRIVQEQFKNILKYSQAKQVKLSLTCSSNVVQLVINDNGVGFDPKTTYRGIGLSNMHDRACFYNGKVDIESAPGKGCTLTVSIPLQN